MKYHHRDHFSLICTLTSPSLKRPTASPSEVYRRLAIRCASSGVALPALHSGTRRTSGMRPAWKESAENCAGRHDPFFRCIKARCNVWSKGDVVTETQLPGLKHGSVCAGKDCAFRHKAIEPFRGCSSTRRASDSHVSNSAKTQAPVPVRRDGAYSNSEEAPHQPRENVFLR